MRERQAQVANDLDVLDRTLETLGYSGDVTLTARVPRVVRSIVGSFANTLSANFGVERRLHVRWPRR